MIPASLVRPASHAARGIPRSVRAGVFRNPVWRRHIVTIHEAKAEFITIDRFGSLVSKEVIISRATENDSSLMMGKEVGHAMRSAIVQQIGVSLANDPEAVPLKFYHKSLHFAHELLPYPRLVIDKGLAGPVPGDISAATLWLWAPASSEITLNDTPDHLFTMSSRESHDRLKHVLEELKDR